MDTKPLHSLPSFTNEEVVKADTRSRLGYNVDRHSLAQRHVLARNVVKRIQGDMASYSARAARATSGALAVSCAAVLV